MTQQFNLTVKTVGRGLYDITESIEDFVSQTDIKVGLCHLFIQHTSASLVISENADPAVMRDLEVFMQRYVPDEEALYEHNDEGPDDMPSHIRSILTQTFLLVPIKAGKLALGRWQGLYLWEHRLVSHQRQVMVTLL